MGWAVNASVVERYLMKGHGKNILRQEDSHLHENLRQPINPRTKPHQRVSR